APEPQEEPWPRAAPVAPNPEDGGSYIGFADLSTGASEEAEIVPDRFDAGEPAPTSTRRVQRENLFRGDVIEAPDADAGGEPPSSFNLSDEPIEGLTGAFEEHRSAGVPPHHEAAVMGAPDPDPVWAPPPEAPPAETWQEPASEPAGQPSAAPAPFAPLPAPSPAPVPRDGAPLNLTPEAIDLIAERVVERLSDRVVREVAWEVIPQVAEALVRRRIKELEEDESR
ncbi:MAG TPA: hypothetical protein VGA64_12200, partial [Candidatus Polarisedimenticolia bacterium]